MYLITAYFDDQTNRILANYQKKLAEHTGNFFMIENQVPPHLTLSSMEARSVEVLRPSFLALSRKVTGGTIQFVSIGQLLPYVFYITPLLDSYLLGLSQQVYDAIKDIPETMISRYYTPGSWFPHITLGKKLEKNQMLQAFLLMQDQFQPFTGTITELGLSKVNPHVDVERFFVANKNL